MKSTARTLTCIAVLAGAAFAQSLVPELIYYKFNEGSGAVTANEGSPGAGSTSAALTGMTFGPGKFGSGIVGTGAVGSANNVATGYTMNLAGSSWTIEFWFQPSSLGSLRYLCGVPVGGSFRIFTASTAGNLTLTGSGVSTVTAPGGTPPVGTWVHVAYVFDAASSPPTVTPYVNGIGFAPVTQTSPITLNTGNFVVGSQLTGSAGLAGTLDEFRFWTSARTAAEILASYNGELFEENVFVAATSGGGAGDLSMSLTMINSTAVEGFTFISGTPSPLVGAGPLLGIVPDALTWPILSMPASPGNPLHFTLGTPGVYPDVPFVVPAGTLTFLSGQTYDMVTMMLAPGFVWAGRSSVQRLVW